MRPHRLALPIVATAILGCSSSAAQSTTDASPDATNDASREDASSAEVSTDAPDALDGSSEVEVDAAPVDDDPPFATERAACAFTAGALPSETFGPSIAKLDIPIDVFVIAMQENRSFDEYFSQLPKFGQTDVEVAKDDQTCPNQAGDPISRFHQTSYCTDDTDHSWVGSHGIYDNGKMDEWILANEPEPAAYRVLGYYDATDLPFYYGLATTFGVGDHAFSSTLGPTFPNRLFLYEGTAEGETANVEVTPGTKTIFEVLTKAGVSWKLYSAESSPLEGVYGTSLNTKYAGHVVSEAQFATDAKAGTLPHVVFFDALHSEHPNGDIQSGEVEIEGAYRALAASPQWSNAAFFLVYDEAGGGYDHLPPPSACIPDSTPPTRPGAYDRYGFRVPFVVASPYSKPHYVSHRVTDHTSLLRLLELKYDLPAFTARDANANVPLDYFDFSKPSFATPPDGIAKATVASGHCP